MIELTNLKKILGHDTVIDINSLCVDSGEIAAIVGPVGSGKTNLFELLTGKSLPSGGTVRVDGVDPATQKDEFSRKIGILFADDGLYMRKSPKSNLEFHCQLYGLPKSRAEEVLETIGLADQANAKLDKLPTGLARRLAFGRTILHDPPTLLLVDPFTRCDEATISLLSDLIHQLADNGTTILILADDEAHLPPICSVTHIINRGQIVQTYHPQEEREALLPFKIPVRLEDKVALVNPADILYADAEGGRTYLQTSEGRLPTQFTLSELEERLSRSGFFRAHRAYLVNLQHVKEVIPYTRNSYTLKLNDEAKTQIPLSKSAAGELRDLLGY
jgi:ABC-2 type transport system ATP-binding protein